jgi:molybdopterin/thiamine biosynthesis adenylyltransferase
MKLLHDFLRTHATDGYITFSNQEAAVMKFGLSFVEMEEVILSMDLLPERYRKNRETISLQQQMRLFKSCVAVVGCGGLGGYIIEELARIGIGKLICIDPDVFEEHNLNRQLHATLSTLGGAKVAAVAQRIGEINPAVTIIPLQKAFSRETGIDLLNQAHVVIDALDSIPMRLVLADVCDVMNIPLIHGSIAGWYGQVTTQFPGDKTLQKIFGGYTLDSGIEEKLGNPSFSPALVASIEVAEAIKVLLGEGTTLRGRLLSINLLDMEIVVVCIEDEV